MGSDSIEFSPHPEYQRLGKSGEERQAAYRQLLRTRIVENTLDEIREATNKVRTPGEDRSKRKIDPWLTRRVAPMARDGDHKSDTFRKQARINRV